MMTVNVKIYPSIGDAYNIIIPLPYSVENVNAFVDEWINDNLKLVDHYTVGLLSCMH